MHDYGNFIAQSIRSQHLIKMVYSAVILSEPFKLLFPKILQINYYWTKFLIKLKLTTITIYK